MRDNRGPLVMEDCIGVRVRFQDGHPWCGHTGTIVRVGSTMHGKRFVVKLDPGHDVPCDHEAFIMNTSDAKPIQENQP